MNRRTFFGASLAGIIAALSLPFERFAEWCKAWLPQRETLELALGADVLAFDIGMTLCWAGESDSRRSYITAIDRSRGVITVTA